MKIQNLKYTTKLFLGVLAICMMLIVSISLTLIFYSKNGLYELGEVGVSSMLQSMYNGLLLRDKEAREVLLKNGTKLEAMLRATGEIHLQLDQEIDFPVVDENSGQATVIKIKTLKAGDVTLSNNNEILDKIAEEAIGEATIFQVVGERLLRVATTVKKADGSRAIGTYASDEVATKILRGESFEGKAMVMNDWYLSRYIPLYDTNKKVFAALFIGQPLLSVKVREYISSTKMGKGYFFIYNDEGIAVVHPSLEGKNLFEVVDAFKNHKGGKLEYVFKGESKISYTVYIEPWGYHLGIGMNKVDMVGGIDKTMLVVSSVIGLLGAILSVVTVFFLVRSIDKPLMNLAKVVKEIGKGDYRIELPTYYADDAVGHINKSVEEMKAGMIATLKDVINLIQALASSSTELAAISAQMQKNAKSTMEVSAVVAKSSTEMSDNMHTVSAAMEQSTTNLQLIAAATTEMGATTDEIAQNGERAHEVTQTAVGHAERSSANVNDLGRAVESIEKIVDVITAISDQTNLLALNATIEAARAGDAGKGFAVVANEIKELARQTADATREIKNSIGDVQIRTNETIRDISLVMEVINDVNMMVTTIATAVEEQSLTTSEVVKNVNEASSGIGEINEKVADSSQVTQEISVSIAEAQSQARQVSEGSEHVTAAAHDLSKMAEKLTALVGRFKI